MTTSLKESPLTQRLIPNKEKLIVKPVERESVTKGGIVLPDTAKEKPELGTILHVSEQASFFKVGDTVLFGKYSGSEFTHEDRKLLVLDEGDILAVVRDEPVDPS